MRIRPLLAAGAVLIGGITPLTMTQSARAENIDYICLQAVGAGACIDQPAGSTSQLQIDNGVGYYEDVVGTVSNQFSNDTLDNDYMGDPIYEFFNDGAHDRCIRVNASAPDQPVLGSPGAACEFVLSNEDRLVSIGSSNDNGGSSPYYLETRATAKGSFIITDTVTNGRYTKWLT
jgi:hypothetical protein